MRGRRITVGELRDLIKGMDDETVVLVPGDDHSYRRADASVGTAGYSKKFQMYFEWYGEENAGETEVPVPALIIE